MNSVFSKLMLVAKVFAQMLFLFGFLAWLYGVIVQVTHPEWLPMPLLHLTLWLRVDTFTILSFFISAIGFFVWRIIVELSKPQK
jgi:hypothetical protein